MERFVWIQHVVIPAVCLASRKLAASAGCMTHPPSREVERNN
jgi:hypothetical protein